MLIQNINPTHVYLRTAMTRNEAVNKTSAPAKCDSFMRLSFKRKEDAKYDKAVKYLEARKKNGLVKDINDLDLNKLDGIQNGLSRFEKLNMKQITFVLRDLIAVNVNRGFERYCAHCILDGIMPLKTLTLKPPLSPLKILKVC